MADQKAMNFDQKQQKKEDFASGSEMREASEKPEIELISFADQPESIEKAITRIEKDVLIFKKIKIVALKLTGEKDWLLQKKRKEDEGSPYLQDRGAEQIRIAFAVDVSGLELRSEWMEDERGRYITYIASGKAFSKKLGSYLEDIGTCSQRDRFFAKIGDRFKEIEDVDLTNIRKKAVTNLYNRLIKRTTGILNVTVDDLKLAGLDISKIPTIEYAEGSTKREAQLSDQAKEERTLIEKLANLLTENDDEKRALLKKLTLFKGDDQKERFIQDVKELHSEKWISALLGKIKGEMKKQMPDTYAKMFPAAAAPADKNEVKK